MSEFLVEYTKSLPNFSLSFSQITGLVLLSVGAAIKAVYYGYHVFLDDQYFSAPNLLIAVGLIILLVSFLGCCGAVKENHCMIVSVGMLSRETPVTHGISPGVSN